MIKRKFFYFIASVFTVLIIFFGISYILALPIIDSLLPKEIQEQQLQKRALRYFPLSIGDFKLVGESKQIIEVGEVCNKIENNDILKKTGKTGDACMKTFSVVYSKQISTTTATTTSKLVKVNTSTFTKAGDMLGLLIEESTTADILSGKTIFRTAPFRLGWSPNSVFDLIMIDEGQKMVSSTTIVTSFDGQAKGDNDVTQYFISKYPPKK